ncbi:MULTISPECIES: MogA/MoaB family molybdenum cofactor biosynthesis protein [unclassified Corynebacterium]|uniref:MogA/MoaB family molybdenum cofactor biosynthesis protein n=2 Tax=Corynebacterium TaxID=1716 RepID=UPI0026481A8E|nr:molybdopterin-binding protein [Corynebacterium sp.]MDN5581267.1 molybdopterin-binding protein [Corynebacterium sp.]MDN5718865.1 molybdopterin-binding protein [Corynebacterium sp.]MDN6325576.1 molybdopterin-binding protein [Corynebacterium sp.]MDN6511539.1 molybdopterin-binding protein [Corynebacterium sp.]
MSQEHYVDTDETEDSAGVITVPGIEDFARVEQESIERLDAEITEPGDEVFRSMDIQENGRESNNPRHSLLHALVVIVTDHPDDADQSGELVAELLAEEDYMVDAVLTVESGKSAVRQALETAVVGGADLVITVGGTGVSPRDKAPEATKAVLDKRIPGLSQALRSSALACNAVDGGLSRGVAGVSGSTVVVNLAATRGAIRDGMATLCPLVRHVIADLSRA